MVEHPSYKKLGFARPGFEPSPNPTLDNRKKIPAKYKNQVLRNELDGASRNYPWNYLWVFEAPSSVKVGEQKY